MHLYAFSGDSETGDFNLALINLIWENKQQHFLKKNKIAVCSGK